MIRFAVGNNVNMKLLVQIACALGLFCFGWHFPCGFTFSLEYSQGRAEVWLSLPFAGRIRVVQRQPGQGARSAATSHKLNRLSSAFRAARVFLTVLQRYQDISVNVWVEIGGKDPMAVALAYGWVWFAAGMLKSAMAKSAFTVRSHFCARGFLVRVTLESKLKLGPLLIALAAATYEYWRKG